MASNKGPTEIGPSAGSVCAKFSRDWSYSFVTKEVANEVPMLPAFSDLEKNHLIDEKFKKRLLLVFHEAFMNAIDHGNLELSSTLREYINERGKDAFAELRNQRLSDPRFGERQVHVQIKLDGSTLHFIVTDEGPGFLRETKVLENDSIFPLCSGRGLSIIKATMDEVSFNAQGNQIHMKKVLVKEG